MECLIKVDQFCLEACFPHVFHQLRMFSWTSSSNHFPLMRGSQKKEASRSDSRIQYIESDWRPVQSSGVFLRNSFLLQGQVEISLGQLDHHLDESFSGFLLPGVMVGSSVLGPNSFVFGNILTKQFSPGIILQTSLSPEIF